MTSTTLTPDLIEYARTYCECKIREKRVPTMTAERLEDMTSAALEVLCRRWPQYDPSRSGPRTFICIVLRNALRNAWDHYWRVYGREEPLEEATETAQSVTDAECVERLMPPGIQREICLMRAAGATIHGICRRLDCSRATVHRALDALYRRLTNNEE
ncbi:MAG: sigma-70 family RNA polymerase sigma factor [Victivallales bacterium]|nr:sigma-70 family RNA polymerase sigma factor [Victivallales bacterium]